MRCERVTLRLKKTLRSRLVICRRKAACSSNASNFSIPYCLRESGEMADAPDLGSFGRLPQTFCNRSKPADTDSFQPLMAFDPTGFYRLRPIVQSYVRT
jgi:hypothetical protein